MENWLTAAIVIVSIIFLARSDIKLHLEDKHLQGQAVGHSQGVYSEDSCDEFFFGMPFPKIKSDQTGLVKLCQTQQHDGYVGPAVYATLFSITDRIPVYSADVITLYPNSTGYMRPDEKYWNRVALELCNIDPSNLPLFPISSRLGSAGSDTVACGANQAINRDYKGNWEALGVDRGHLNPNAINFQDQESQVGTFTLTNAAPQFSAFNQIAWEQYECVTKYIVMKYTPLQRVYVVTGTMGQAKDPAGNLLWMNDGRLDKKNRVKVPEYYWKAVCYPGNPWDSTSPWAYAIIDKNIKDAGNSSPDNIMPVEKFSSMYFEDDVFAEPCLSATMGPIQNLFDDWTNHVNSICHGRRR
uniref:endonuclease domain-containing 1 protein-like n=1 Tax=Styela clava TaxID=7725 RepID=UPI00193A7F51|nr:endonuclease domain-containing 1 protein-like [Styela clava]